MEARITGENDERVGLYVDDNNGVEHWIEIEFDGEIKYHEQDGYSDYPSERTQAENEHVRQVRRFAKWHVYRERGYETMPRHENPDCIVAAMVALSALSEQTVKEQFDDLRTQIESHYDDSSVSLPFDDADPDDMLVYRKDLYLTPDPTDVEPQMVDQYIEHATDVDGVTDVRLENAEDFEQWLMGLLNDRDRLEEQFPAFELEAVSELHYLHTDGKTEQTEWADSPLEREPDARIELAPVEPGMFELFRLLLISNLSNQVRDRYLMMGQSPPEPFRKRGFGTYRGTVKQQINDMYERYVLTDEPISGWQPY